MPVHRSSTAGANRDERPTGPVLGCRPRPATDGTLEVTVRTPLPGVLVVGPVGEIDMTTAPGFRVMTFDAVRCASRHVVVDLARVTFMGSTALAVLVDAHQLAAGRGIGCCPADGGRAARRVLALTGLDATLGHRESADDVLRELRRAAPG